jgi:hypothetical protein
VPGGTRAERTPLDGVPETGDVANGMRVGHGPGFARVVFAVAGLLLSTSRAAVADPTKEQCIQANAGGQDLRRESKLAAARGQFLACASASCPALVRDDCAKRLDDVERAQPTIVFDAKDGAGRDVSMVTVTVDGHPLVDRLDGTSLRVDPGEHAFVFTVAGQPPQTQTFVLKEGDKDRREKITVGPAASTGAPPVASSPASPEEARPAHGGLGTERTVAVVLAGAGLAGIAVGSVFGALTLSEVDKQKSDCASPTQCASRSAAASAHSAAMTDRTVSTVAFLAGGALLAGGVVLFLVAPRATEQARDRGPSVALVPSAGPTGYGALLQGAF